MSKSICQNCREIVADKDLKVIVDILDRVAPGEMMPSGGCPKCGALCHPVMTTLQLMLNVTYDANGTSASKLVDLLHDIADRASGEGLMTGDTEAEVVSWQAKVVNLSDHNA